MIKKVDGKYKVVESKPAAQPDPNRRDLALTLMGLLGASAFLKGCALPEGGEKDVDEKTGVGASALQSSTLVQWFDTYAELRNFVGGTTTSSNNIAFCRDPHIGGLFGWTTDTTTADNDATIIVPTEMSRTGCWKRIYSGPLDVRWFGAKGDGTTNDKGAIQDAVDYALIHGDELYFAPGYYVIDGTINIGTPIFESYSFAVERTAQLGEVEFIDNSLHDNKVNCRNISLTFAPNAFIVADIDAETPTPAIAYNLDNYHGTGFVRDLKIIGPSAFVGGEFNLDSVTPAANVIGFFGYIGCSQIDKAMLAGLEYGIATVTAYWSSIRDVTAFHCGDGLNIAQGNAMTVSNVTFFDCNRGLVFDGTGAKIMMINTEQVNYDIVIFAADGCTFGPGYLEDSRTSNLSAYTYITSSATASSDLVTHCIYDGLRIGGANNNKKGIDIVRNQDVTFLNVRTYNRAVTATSDSYGTLINCEAHLTDLAGPKWTSLSRLVHLGQAGSIGSVQTDTRIVDTVCYYWEHDFGSISAATTIMQNLSIAWSVTYTTYSVYFQVTGTGASDLIMMSARIGAGSSNNVVIHATNPTSSSVSHYFKGNIIFQFFTT